MRAKIYDYVTAKGADLDYSRTRIEQILADQTKKKETTVNG